MGAKVLIVDDDPELLNLIGLALKRADYRPLAARTAEAAFEKVRSEQPDLVILDVMLPGTSGIEFCRQIRQQAEVSNLPIIMLSARTQVDDKIEGLQAGADDYLTKPISAKEMVARVEALLQRTERLRQTTPSDQGKVFAFMGAKGGVGTTTVTVNVGVSLATEESHDVIIAELRPTFGTVAVQMGKTVHESLADLLALEGSPLNERNVKMHLTPDSSGMEVLYGPPGGDKPLALDPDWTNALVRQLSRMADFVLLDLPNDLSPSTQAALEACDLILLVLGPEADSLAAGKRTIDALNTWGIRRGVVEAVLVNQAPLAMGINVVQIETDLGCDVVGVIPPAADACAAANRQGRPLLVVQPNNPVADKINELAEKMAVYE